jgi:uncharacterized protein (TIGR02265 family)
MGSLSTSSTAFMEPGLEQLLVLIGPEDTCRGMFFNGVLQSVNLLGGPEARTRCLAVIGERRFVDFLNYPVRDFLQLLFIATEVLGPRHGGRDAIQRQLGRRAVEDFLGATVGKTILALAGHEPKRLLSSFPNACKVALSYGVRTVEWLGPNQARLAMRGDFLPMAYHEGVLLAVLERSLARNPEVRGRRLGVLDMDYELRWE